MWDNSDFMSHSRIKSQSGFKTRQWQEYHKVQKRVSRPEVNIPGRTDVQLEAPLDAEADTGDAVQFVEPLLFVPEWELGVGISCGD